MNQKLNRFFTALILTTVLVGTIIFSGCVDENPNNKTPYYFSFEDGMDGWESDGTDLLDPPINWSVAPSDDLASDGNYSVKLYLNNLNDAGKIWMEKRFELDPNTQYEIDLHYSFATGDFGDFNLFTIIAGANANNPESVEDLVFQGDTGHHQDQQDGFVWLDKSYTFTVQTNDTGDIYIMIGVWGTWETPRSYYVDEVNLSFTPLSFENFPVLSGEWVISYYDFMGNVTKKETATIIQDNSSIQLRNGTEILFSGILLKNRLPKPHAISDFVITDCDFRGLGIDYIYVYNESYMKTDLPLCENCQPAVFSKTT